MNVKPIGTYPFGSPLHPVLQTDRTPRKVFVLGVYASAVHARWVSPEGKTLVTALAVASAAAPTRDRPSGVALRLALSLRPEPTSASVTYRSAPIPATADQFRFHFAKKSHLRKATVRSCAQEKKLLRSA